MQGQAAGCLGAQTLGAAGVCASGIRVFGGQEDRHAHARDRAAVFPRPKPQSSQHTIQPYTPKSARPEPEFPHPPQPEDAALRFDVLRCDGFAKFSLQQECRQTALKISGTSSQDPILGPTLPKEDLETHVGQGLRML